MPCSCLRRRRRRRIQHHDEAATNKAKEKTGDKPRSTFAEAIFVLQPSSRSRLDFGSCPASIQVSPRASCHSQISHDKGYPLPLPLPLNSHDLSARSTACSSLSSVSYNWDGDELVGDNGLFCLFRNNVDSGLNSWPMTTCAATRNSRPFVSSSEYSVCDRSFEFQTEGSENLSRPIHRLPRPPTSPTIPSVVEESKWKKGKLLGTGTLGHVYAGFNSENGKMCAIKEIVMVSNDHMSKQFLKQLHQEIEVLSQFSHPNILQYCESRLAEEKLSIYMESVSGGSVLELLREYGPLSENVIQCYTRKILCGLAYLHERNTAHRGLKGANILVTPKGEVKLADFGMTKHIESYSSMLFTQGSSYWLAPEVMKNNGAYSLAGDIWSLGCVVLEMATSKPPCIQYGAASAVSRIANDQEIPEIPSELSEEAKSFIKLCLQRNPSSRPTAAQLMHHPFIQERQENRIQKEKCSWH